MKKLCNSVHIMPLQVEHHPKMTRYAAENFTLRQENRQLRSLDAVMKAEEAAATTAAELDDMFQKAVESESKMINHQIRIIKIIKLYHSTILEIHKTFWCSFKHPHQ